MAELFAAVTAPTRVTEAGLERAVVDAGYLHGLRVAGLLPLIASPLDDDMTHQRMFEVAGALLLTGGEDIDPSRYGASVKGTRRISAERDAMEFELVERALERDLPVLAICRGMQVLNVVLGGTLHQDLAMDFDDSIAHDSWEDFDGAIHAITPDDPMLLGGVFDHGPTVQNSAHHQGIDRIADVLTPVGHTSDGLVEAVEFRRPGAAWIVGVQWHPERKIDRDDGVNRRLFEAFGDAARGLSQAPGPRLMP